MKTKQEVIAELDKKLKISGKANKASLLMQVCAIFAAEKRIDLALEYADRLENISDKENTYFLIAGDMISQKLYTEALALCEKIHIGEFKNEIKMLIARKYILAERLPEALVLIEKITEKDTKSWVYSDLIIEYLKLGKFKEALKLLPKTKHKKSSYSTSVINIAQEYAKRKKIAQAIELIESEIINKTNRVRALAAIVAVL